MTSAAGVRAVGVVHDRRLRLPPSRSRVPRPNPERHETRRNKNGQA
jgi:hypothetical protein